MSSNKNGKTPVLIRHPMLADTKIVWDFIRQCSPLEQNSIYCNALQCSDFSKTCLIAEHEKNIIGWVSGYIPHERQNSLFIWQVGVKSTERGRGIAKEMILHLFKQHDSIEYIQGTISDDNIESLNLFSSIAKFFNTKITKTPWFDKEMHFYNSHEGEDMVTVGPIIL